jgi:hypothetical protein
MSKYLYINAYKQDFEHLTSKMPAFGNHERVLQDLNCSMQEKNSREMPSRIVSYMAALKHGVEITHHELLFFHIQNTQCVDISYIYIYIYIYIYAQVTQTPKLICNVPPLYSVYILVHIHGKYMF